MAQEERREERREAKQAAEAAARRSYGRLLAILAGATRDIAAAEEALSEALVAALASWPERGVPANPEGWLLTAARRAHLDALRHAKVTVAARRDIVLRAGEAATRGEGFPDERLKLLFVCAHPAIDPAVRTPLMLQAVLGLDAARIAKAFLVPAATMAQRLVRAKTKIRDAGLRYAVPEPAELPGRIDDVLQAIYAAYGTGWNAIGTADDQQDLAGEAVHLGRLIVSLAPKEPEPKGLLALMLYCESRRAARRDAAGRFVPLSRQDTALWSRDMIIEAEGLLTEASRHGRFGRFQCEAAIQSVHAQRGITGVTNHAALRTLYDLLLERAPSLGVIVGRAANLLESGEAEAALAALDEAPAALAEAYQPYWVVKARALQRLGRPAEAALGIAISLTDDPSVSEFLAQPRPEA
jgi:RNA polymerase sigma-70 factor (ECF subfamily)